MHSLNWLNVCLSLSLSLSYAQILLISLLLLLLSNSLDNNDSCCAPLQVLRYFDYVFTGVFTFEMLIKVTKYWCVTAGLDVCSFYVSIIIRF